jgi:predicted deacylase
MRITPAYAAFAAACCILLQARTAVADPPETTPGGPWSQPGQNESLASIRDYPQLVSTLEKAVAASHGAARLSYSPFRARGSGRPIPIVTIGSGDRGILIIANQHGNEYVVSNSAVEIVRALTSSAAGARAIREALTVTNPAGEHRRVRRHAHRLAVAYNVDPFCTTGTCPAFYGLGQGYDINRYHSYLRSDPRDDPNTGPIDVGQGDNPVPEAVAGRAAYDAAGGPDKVEVVLDLHHQGTRIDADGDMVTASTLWPNATDTADALGIRPQFDAAVYRSRQVVSTLLQAVERKGYANFSRYPGTTPPGISRNAYGLLGSASVLIEVRGDIAQKSSGYLAKTAYVASTSVIDALADGSLYDADVGIAEALPLAPGDASGPQDE